MGTIEKRGSVTDPATREEIHHRQLDLRFYRRNDGRYEVEGRLVDTKRHPFRRPLADADIPPGQPLHDIVVCLVVDETLVVHDATATMATTPFAVCRGAAPALAVLKGLRIGKGFNQACRERLGGAAGCSHILEMLAPMATTAIQGIAPRRLEQIGRPENEALRVAKVDSCYAYGAEREVVARLWPHLHRRRTDDSSDG